MGKPVVATELPEVRRTFGDTVLTYPSGDVVALADAILRLVDDAAFRDELVARAQAHVRTLAWEVEGPRYVELIERLAAGAGS